MSSPSASSNGIAATFLVLCCAISFYTLWGGLWRNGYFSDLASLWKRGPHVLPGSKNPVLTHYTMVPIFDDLVTFSVVLFTNITDGTAPQFSLFAFYFTGQWASVLTVVFMEGLREGNKGLVVSWSMLWLLLLQGLTYACGMPLYCLIHLLTSLTAVSDSKSLARHVEIGSTGALRDLPLSIIIGYGIPTILAGIPLRNNLLHQWFGGFWQGHPIYIVLVQSLTMLLRSRPGSSSPVSAVNTLRGLQVRKRVYVFAFGTAAFTHLTAFIILGARTPFSILFTPSTLGALTFKNTYLPPPFWKTKDMASMARAVFSFFQYDLYYGSITSIFWASTLYFRSCEIHPTLGQCLSLFCKMLSVCILGGPSAVVVFLIYSRDQNASLAEENRKLAKDS